MEKQINLLKLTKNKDMKYLDMFLNDYEWGIFEMKSNKNLYYIYDLQCSCTVEINYTLEQVINRVVCRALDYEINYEHCDSFYEDFDSYNNKRYMDYLNGLYRVAKLYRNPEDKYEEEWLFDIGKEIRERNRFFEDINK